MAPKAVKRKGSSKYFFSDGDSSQCEDKEDDRCKLKRKCNKKSMNYCEDNFTDRYFFKRKIFSSDDVIPEDVFFYFNVQYQEMQETITDDCLETIEDCLEHVLKFVADEDEVDYENEFKWRNEPMAEIVRKYIDEEDIAWIYKWDRLDWKTATKKKIAKARTFLNAFSKKTRKPGLFFMQSAYDVHNLGTKKEVGEEEDKNEKSEAVKSFIHSVSVLTCPQSYLRNGACKEVIHFCVRSDQISTNSDLLDDRDIKMIVKPDGVFTNLPETGSSIKKNIPKWEIVIEVYGPEESGEDSENEITAEPAAGISKTSSDVMNTSDTEAAESASLQEGNFLSPTISDPCRFKRRGNLIADPTYRSQIRKHIVKSLPSYYKKCAHTRKKMAGQHVLQLFAQILRRNLLEHTDKDETDYEKSIGMFIINEFIYFSRLDVSSLMCDIIQGRMSHMKIGKYDEKEHIKKKPPVVRYSNFRLDITKRNHRLALVFFLKVFLFSKASESYPTDEEYEDWLTTDD